MTHQFQSMRLAPRFSGGGVVIVLLALSFVRASAAPVEPAKAPPAGHTNAVVEIPKSVFVIPTTPLEGKNPFFPKSTQLGFVETPGRTNPPIRAELVLKILSGTPASPLATINNWTFGVGEEAEVLTAAGRVRVRCVEIKQNEQAVVIEVNGERRELRFPRRR